MIDMERDRFGSSGFCNARARRNANIYEPQGAYIGHDTAGRPCYSDQQSAICIVGGARSLKGSIVQPNFVDGCLKDKQGHHHIVGIDWKGQESVVGALQVRQGRHGYYFNPRKRRGMPSHHINAVGHLRRDSTTLIPDTMMTMASWTPETDPKAAYFQRNAQIIETASAVTMARKDGVVTLPNLADKMAALGDATDEWLSFEYDISVQPEPQINGVAALLQRMRSGQHEGGGWEGIKGEIIKSFSCMLDPQLRESLSPPYDFSFSQLTQEGSPPCLVSIMEDLAFAESSGQIVRTLLTNALIEKRRALNARPQFWCLQEIGNIGAWPLAEALATISAGYGIRTAYVVQSTRQLDNLKPGASEVILNSCGTQIYLGTRSVQQASLIQRQLGRVTLEYQDSAEIERADAARRRAITGAIMGGTDPLSAMTEAQHQSRMAGQTRKMARDLRGIDEILGEPNGRAYVFMPGVLKNPFYATVRPYWQRRDLAGTYLGDPFHAKPGTVEIATWFGQRHRKVITEDAPRRYRDWPQYRDTGQWSYVKGYRP